MKKNISHYLFEVIAIFIGITGSFLVEDYRINKIKQKQINYALEALDQSLESDSIVLAFNVVQYDSQISVLNSWRNDDFATIPKPDKIFIHFLALNSSIGFSSDKTGYEIFIETEGKELIQNSDLRRRISNYYNNIGESMEGQSRQESEFLIAFMNSNMSSDIEFPPKSLTDPNGLIKIYLPLKKYLNSLPEPRNRLGNQLIMLSLNKITTQQTLDSVIELKREVRKELEQAR